MMDLFRRLASTRLTLLGMAMLAIGAGLSYDNPQDVSVWVLVVPLGFLALNLFSAILVLPAINRRPGLLMFHIGLLAICVLVAIGRLTVYEARIEMLQGTAFDASQAFNVRQGPWHQGELDKLSFVQGPYSVEYGPELTRGPTRSRVATQNTNGEWEEQIIGDDTPLLLEGYRFYTSFNKGFAPMLTWVADNGEVMTGAVHMPSYPLFEYKQDNDWHTPVGEELKLWLRLNTGYTETEAWKLDVEKSTAVLVVNTGEQRWELNPGDEVSLNGGRLRYDGLNAWMGYKIYYDPTLKLLFIAAIMAVVGLMHHYWTKFSTQPMREDEGQSLDANEVRKGALQS